MRIDWYTVAAQLLNFLVLVWLLKRLLYRRVLDAMAARETRIRERMESATQREQEAQREAQQYDSLRQQLEQDRQQMLMQARREADEIRDQLREQARTEIGLQRARWLDELDTERAQLLTNLRRRIAHEVAHATRQALTDLADASLESQMVRVLIGQLRALDADERAALVRDMGAAPVRVRTSFELKAALREEISDALAALLGPTRVDFETVAEPVCGIEIATDGRVLGWNVTDYLAELENDLERAMRPARESL